MANHPAATISRTGVASAMAVALVMFSSVAHAGGEVPEYAEDVSLIQLLAAPSQFNGRRVRVIGFLRLEFEGNAIFLHEEDCRHRISRNALWIDVPQSVDKKSRKYSKRYVVVEAVFDASRHGHMGLYAGTLTDVTRLDPWR